MKICFGYFISLSLLLIRQFKLTSSQTFNSEAMVWTIDGLGYQDFALFMCYGGEGQTTTPLRGNGELPTETYPDLTSALLVILENMENGGEPGCFPFFVEDPSDGFSFFKDDCDEMGKDSVFTFCFGPLPNAPQFQCGRHDWIWARSFRMEPEGPPPNCHPFDDAFGTGAWCPPDGKTRFQRYVFQQHQGIVHGYTRGSCHAPFFLGLNWDGVLCGNGTGALLTPHGGYVLDMFDHPCDTPSTSFIDWQCPSDPNYPRSAGCLKRNRRTVRVLPEEKDASNDGMKSISNNETIHSALATEFIKDSVKLDTLLSNVYYDITGGNGLGITLANRSSQEYPTKDDLIMAQTKSAAGAASFHIATSMASKIQAPFWALVLAFTWT